MRNSGPICGSQVFGGQSGKHSSHTNYAGTLDDPSAIRPRVAIFTRDRPSWAVLAPGLTVFETKPPG